jgi:hypothetical protein
MSETPFPKSLALLGLNPGFKHKQFVSVMNMERSNQLRELAYNEWLYMQDEKYDNHPFRWYLSYIQMKTEYTKDMT